MRVVLVQHAEALAKEIDPDRPLSPRGRDDARRLGAFLAAAGLRVGRMIHSGKTRARQTAQAVADALQGCPAPEVQAGLGPDDAVPPLAQALRSVGVDTLLVGHLPFVGRLVDEMVTGECVSGTVTFHPGTAVCLETTASGQWSVCWMIRPELLHGV